MTQQLGFAFDEAVERRKAHKWYGNTCPTCRAAPGELCRPARETGIHGTRTRFERAGECLGAKCEDEADCWGCEP